MKRYFLVRWKKRWPLLPASVAVGGLWALMSLAKHDGKVGDIILFLVCFDVVGILFPFHWGGEEW